MTSNPNVNGLMAKNDISWGGQTLIRVVYAHNDNLGNQMYVKEMYFRVSNTDV